MNKDQLATLSNLMILKPLKKKKKSSRSKVFRKRLIKLIKIHTLFHDDRIEF